MCCLGLGLLLNKNFTLVMLYVRHHVECIVFITAFTIEPANDPATLIDRLNSEH